MYSLSKSRNLFREAYSEESGRNDNRMSRLLALQIAYPGLRYQKLSLSTNVRSDPYLNMEQGVRPEQADEQRKTSNQIKITQRNTEAIILRIWAPTHFSYSLNFPREIGENISIV